VISIFRFSVLQAIACFALLQQPWHIKTLLELQDIHGVALSADGKYIAVASGNTNDKSGTIRLIDAPSGNARKSLTGHKSGVNAVQFSPDEKLLVSGGQDASAIVWDLVSQKTKWLLKGHDKAIKSVAISSDSKIVATGSSDDTVKLWSTATGKLIRSLQVDDTAGAVVFSPDGALLAAGLDDNTICVWDVASGKSLAQIKGHSDMIRALAFSPDGKTLAACAGLEGVVRLWHVGNWDKHDLIRPGFEGVFSVRFTSDGKALMIAGSRRNGKGVVSGVVSSWDIGNNKEEFTLRVHNLPARGIIPSADAKWFLTVGNEDFTDPLGPVNASVKCWKWPDNR
jgi:WD40 repeat protein